MEKWVKSLDTVPEWLRPFYEPKKNSAGEDGFEIQDIGSLKSALANAKNERNGLKTKAEQLDGWMALGLTLDEAKALVAAKKTKEQEDAERKGEWDKLKQQMLDAHNTALAEKDKRISSLMGALETNLIDAEATRELAAEKGAPDLLLHHVRKNVKVIEKDGKFFSQVVGDDGVPRVDGQGNPVSIKALVGEMKKNEKFARAFDGVGHTGSGARPNGQGGGANPPAGSLLRSKMSIKEKSDYIAANGNENYMALPWA